MFSVPGKGVPDFDEMPNGGAESVGRHGRHDGGNERKRGIRHRTWGGAVVDRAHVITACHCTEPAFMKYSWRPAHNPPVDGG